LISGGAFGSRLLQAPRAAPAVSRHIGFAAGLAQISQGHDQVKHHLVAAIFGYFYQK
jgi:hypothetical protein